jgi:hypothetical protein
MESKVVLPEPDGPSITTYSPFLTVKCTSDRACVSSSSVEDTFLIPFKQRTAEFCSSFIDGSPKAQSSLRAMLLELHALRRRPGRGIGDDDFVAGGKSR